MSPAARSVAFLAIGMLCSGALSTLAIKYQDGFVVAHTWHGKPITFYHPAVQSAFMFLGEFLCLLPYLALRCTSRGSRGAAWHDPLAVAPAEHSSQERPAPAAEVRGGGVYDATRAMYDPVQEPLLAEQQQRGSAGSGKIGDVSAAAFVFAVPTLCDALSTTLMNMGLFYTAASVYQMLRGTVVLFAGLFTIAILRRRLYLHHWQGLLLITAGAFVVGLSSVLDGSCDSGHVPGYPPSKYPPGGLGRAPPHAADPEDAPTGVAAALALAANALRAGVTGSRESCGHAMSEDAPHPLLGNVLVIAAQIFSALQFVFEEKYVKHYRVPALLAVGLEGFWGLVLCCLALPLFQNIKGPNGWPVDDVRFALADICSNGVLLATVFATVVSIAVFNWCGVCVTKRLSCTARLSIDACRTVLVWVASLLIGWESFSTAQLLGFIVLVCGSVLYNEMLSAVMLNAGPLTHRSGNSSGGSGVLPSVPAADAYDISPAFLSINVQPHSLGSGGSATQYSQTATSELWGSPSMGARDQRAAPLTPSPGSRNASKSSGQRSTSPVPDGRAPSGSLYNAYYSGMDVSALPPPGSTPVPAGHAFGTPVTPRPGEQHSASRAASQASTSYRATAKQVSVGQVKTGFASRATSGGRPRLQASAPSASEHAIQGSAPIAIGMLSAELGRAAGSQRAGQRTRDAQPSREAGRLEDSNSDSAPQTSCSHRKGFLRGSSSDQNAFSDCEQD